MISGQDVLCIGTIPRFTCLNHLKKKSRQPLPQIRVSHTKSRTCECFDLHKELVPYGEAWSWQKQTIEKKELIQRNEDCLESLIVLQHHPVFTLGIGSDEKHLNFDIDKAPFDVYRTEYGGEVTYHGLGHVISAKLLNLLLGFDSLIGMQKKGIMLKVVELCKSYKLFFAANVECS